MEVREVDHAGLFKEEAAVYASAFKEDPLFIYWHGPSVRDVEAANERLLKPWLAWLARRPAHEVVLHASADGASAALWLPGGAERQTPTARVFAAVGGLVALGFKGMLRFVGSIRTLEKSHPAERHAYLQLLGTMENMRGKGTGSAVIRKMLEKLDAERMPAYLESSNPDNHTFYERHGFRNIGHVTLGKSGPTLTRFWREPQ